MGEPLQPTDANLRIQQGACPHGEKSRSVQCASVNIRWIAHPLSSRVVMTAQVDPRYCGAVRYLLVVIVAFVVAGLATHYDLMPFWLIAVLYVTIGGWANIKFLQELLARRD